MTVFQQAIDDIFQVRDFLEPLSLGDGTAIDVCSYVGDTKEQYTEYGYDHGDAVSVACRCADWPAPQRGQQVTFRGRAWKVAEYETDSHALCYKVTLKSLESK